MSTTSWIVVELVVHPAWAFDERDPELVGSWERLRAALAAPPHRTINASSSDTQALIFMISTDLDGALAAAREHAPAHGVAAFVARVWTEDPRTTDRAPRVVELAAPQPPWPKPGYGSELETVLAASERPPMGPAPDFAKLVAQYGASIHKLEFALLASTAPLADEQVRSLAHGALLGARALRQAAPAHLTPLVQEAEDALERVWDGLQS